MQTTTIQQRRRWKRTKRAVILTSLEGIWIGRAMEAATDLTYALLKKLPSAETDVLVTCSSVLATYLSVSVTYLSASWTTRVVMANAGRVEDCGSSRFWKAEIDLIVDGEIDSNGAEIAIETASDQNDLEDFSNDDPG